MCDQVLWTADSMMMDTSQTERQIQCSHKDVMMNKFISLEEKMKELLHLLNSMICFKWCHWASLAFPVCLLLPCLQHGNQPLNWQRMRPAHTQTYLSLGYVSPEPGAPGGPHYHREPPLSAHSPGQRGSLPALARSLRLGPWCRSGESHSPLLSPGPPQPRNTQQGVSIGGDGDGITWLQIS